MADKQQTETKVDDNKSVVRESFKQYAQVTKEYSDEQLDFIIKTIAPTLNRSEARLMILKCEKLGLDPMSGDLTAYVTKDNNGVRKLTMIVSRNFKREKALRTGNIEWFDVKPVYIKKVKQDDQMITIQVEPWDGELWGAIAEIKKKGMDRVITHMVKLSEYKRNTGVWSKAQTMIMKVAESQAWDIAVPELGGVYDESEDWSTTEDKAPAPEVVDAEKPATLDQLKTIEKMGGDTDRQYNRQEALEEILRLNKLKREQNKVNAEEKSEDKEADNATE